VTTVAGHFAEVVADLADPIEPPATTATVEARPRVLCVGARTGLDEVAATMLVQLLRQSGYEADATTAATLLHGGPTAGPWDLVCLSYLDAGAVRQARRLLLRLRARLGREARYGICLWGASVGEAEQARVVTRAELVATSLAQAIELIGAARSTFGEPPALRDASAA
jgi:hypothetical protein